MCAGPPRVANRRGQWRDGRRFRRMTKMLRLTVFLAGSLAVAGCANDPNATADVEGDRAPLTSPGLNTLNSPTAGPTSAGLSGGTTESAPPELDPNRGTKIR